MPDNTPTMEELIRRYSEELRALQRQQQSANTPSPAPTTSLPTPDFRRDLAAMATTAGETVTPDSDPTFPYTDEDLNGESPFPTEPTTPTDQGAPAHVGYLRVYAFSAGGAQPLAGARVAVSRRQEDSETLYANLLTNRDGYTPVIALPTVNPALSLTPGNGQPYIAYDIQVAAEGFTSAFYDNVPIYGGTYVTQPAALEPLLPGGDGKPNIFTSGGPENL